MNVFRNKPHIGMLKKKENLGEISYWSLCIRKKQHFFFCMTIICTSQGYCNDLKVMTL